MTKTTIQLPPKKIERPSAWIGEKMVKQKEKWITELLPEEIKELKQAAQNFIDNSLDLGTITKINFPLPLLEGKLKDIQFNLIKGIGFDLIRGLPVTSYTQKIAATIFCGIGTYIGRAVSQNAIGHVLGHVRDIGADANDTNARIYQTSQRQTFHTDSSDVVGLLCLKTAKEGGKSLLVSTETIYNEMNKIRPDLAALLFEPIATDRRGEVPDGEKPFFEIPVFNWYQGFLTGMYQRQYIESAQRFPNAIRLNDKHIEALDLFDKLANDAKFFLSMQLEPGDIQFVHNHSQLHDRTGFTDWPELSKRRHLFRLWLTVPGDRPLPECFKQRFGSIQIGDRGGIITPDTKLNVPLD